MTETEVTVKNRKPFALYAILAVSVLPMAAAYFMFFTGVGVPDHTVNAGRLFPNAIALADVKSIQGLDAFNEEKKWRIILPVAGVCDEKCQSLIYITRQVHIRLAQKSTRVERYFVSLSGSASDAIYEDLLDEHRFLGKLSANGNEWNSWLESSGLSIDHETPYYLLVDQEGFAMMQYTAEVDGNDLLKDLKRVLKFSIDYQG
jgi:hypothetical protein